MPSLVESVIPSCEGSSMTKQIQPEDDESEGKRQNEKDDTQPTISERPKLSIKIGPLNPLQEAGSLTPRIQLITQLSGSRPPTPIFQRIQQSPDSRPQTPKMQRKNQSSDSRPQTPTAVIVQRFQSSDSRPQTPTFQRIIQFPTSRPQTPTLQRLGSIVVQTDGAANPIPPNSTVPNAFPRTSEPPPYSETPIYTICLTHQPYQSYRFQDLPPPYDPSMTVRVDISEDPFQNVYQETEPRHFECKPDTLVPLGFCFCSLEQLIVTVALIATFLFLGLGQMLR